MVRRITRWFVTVTDSYTTFRKLTLFPICRIC